MQQYLYYKIYDRYFRFQYLILNWIDREWGGVPEYLRQIGVQSETIQKIKSKFIENLYM